MNKLIAGILVLSVISCNKVTLSTPNDFNVTTASATYSIRDTVSFVLTGNPDYISFYSGEPHSKYALSNVHTLQADSNILSFSTATTAAGGTQPLTANNVLLLASTDYNGSPDSASIRKATWKDISSRANWATTTTTVVSGNIHVEDLTTDTLPVYLAFKYFADTAKSGYLSRKWILSTFSLKSYFKDTTYALGTSYTTGGFYSTSIANPFDVWVYGNTSSITQTLTFNAPASGSLPDEDWAISRPFNLSLYPPDLGVYVKNAGDNSVSLYKKRYMKPGTYTATFVAKNQNSSQAYQVVKQVTLTITP